MEDSLPVEGLVEVDESYFGGVRKGKRGRGAAGKVPVFGILKRGGKVHTVMIPNVRKDTLLPIIRQRIVPDSIVYTDSYPAMTFSTSLSSTTTGSTTQTPTFSIATNHINGIENFWNQAKRTLSRYNGIPESPLSPLPQGDRISLQLRNAQSAIANPQTLGQTEDLANPIWDSPEINYLLPIKRSTSVRAYDHCQRSVRHRHVSLEYTKSFKHMSNHLDAR